MKHKTLEVTAKLGILDTVVAKFKVSPLAKMRDLKEWTDLVCPQCQSKPAWFTGKYSCSCGFQANHWSKLKRVLKGTTTPVLMPRLLASKEQPKATLLRMPKDKYAEFGDATIAEYGVIPEGAASAKNLKLLLAANISLGYVILLRWNDTYEQKIAVLTVSESQKIILRELMPSNLVEEYVDTLSAKGQSFSEKDIEEAKKLLEMIPIATEENLTAEDYRAAVMPKVEAPKAKVQQLEQILATAKTS